MHIKTEILLSSTLLKVMALLLAYFLWSMLSDLYVIQATYAVPVHVRSECRLVIKKVPHQVKVTVRGLRKHVRSIDQGAFAVILDGNILQSGINTIALNHEHFGLPATISVVHYDPINFTVVAEEPVEMVREQMALDQSVSDVFTKSIDTPALANNHS